MLQIEHFSSFLLKFNYNVLVKRDFFLLNAAFGIVILDLICSKYLNKDKDHGKDTLGRAILKLNFKDILFQSIMNLFLVHFQSYYRTIRVLGPLHRTIAQKTALHTF